MRRDRGAVALSESVHVPKAKKKNKKHPGMHIKPLDDGTFHITHEPQGQEPMQPSQQFSARNPKALVRHVRNTYSAPVPDPDIQNPQGAV